MSRWIITEPDCVRFCREVLGKEWPEASIEMAAHLERQGKEHMAAIRQALARAHDTARLGWPVDKPYVERTDPVGVPLLVVDEAARWVMSSDLLPLPEREGNRAWRRRKTRV